jgi:hypothetical protein
LPAASDQIGFEKDVKPLFRAKDREAMKAAFDLWDYADVMRHAQAILGAVSSGKMPCDGAWPHDHVSILERWIAANTPP